MKQILHAYRHVGATPTMVANMLTLYVSQRTVGWSTCARYTLGLWVRCRACARLGARSAIARRRGGREEVSPVLVQARLQRGRWQHARHGPAAPRSARLLSWAQALRCAPRTMWCSAQVQ
jgi:hypothetical protein